MAKSPSIKIFLCGGLGNQLYQYAFARSLALRSGAELKLDAASLFPLDRMYQRTFELDAFALPEDVSVIRKSPLFSRYKRKLLEWRNRGISLGASSYISEPRPLQFEPEYAAFKPTRSVSIFGYWQCEAYFSEHADAIRADLKFREPVCEEHAALYSEIISNTSVAVHVRRVQYDRKLEIDYYKQGLVKMRKAFPEARFYVFSDDPDWWRFNGDNGPDITLVDSGSLPAIEDFKLMSMCRHFIIANSSFSWWAAWLGCHTQKKVLAPHADCWSNQDSIPVDWEVVA